MEVSPKEASMYILALNETDKDYGGPKTVIVKFEKNRISFREFYPMAVFEADYRDEIHPSFEKVSLPKEYGDYDIDYGTSFAYAYKLSPNSDLDNWWWVCFDLSSWRGQDLIVHIKDGKTLIHWKLSKTRN